MSKNGRSKRGESTGIMVKKRYISGVLVGVLLICLLFILSRPAGTTEGAAVSTNAPSVELPSGSPEMHDLPMTANQTNRAPNRISVAVVSEPSEEEAAKPDVGKRILDLRDDDIPYNADWAIYELSRLLPDDEETVEQLIDALDSDDWQQRQIAGYILARWATHTDLSGNRQFLKVMVEALCGDPPLVSMYGQYVAETFLCGQGDQAVGLLQDALRSENERQRGGHQTEHLPSYIYGSGLRKIFSKRRGD